VVALIVVVTVIAASAGGGGTPVENHTAFCRDLDNATTTFGRVDPATMIGNLTPAQKSQMRQAASLATSLANRAPSEPKPDLAAIARDYDAVLSGHLTGDPADAIPMHTAALVFWWSSSCTSV
jgi:hypothetical protein